VAAARTAETIAEAVDPVSAGSVRIPHYLRATRKNALPRLVLASSTSLKCALAACWTSS
jgi:hypothetical protein